MKAIEFIKKFWLGFSKDCVDNRLFSVGGAGGLVSVPDDLKPYIDAWELVQNRGGLDEAKDHTMVLALIEEYEQIKQLRKAIHLVEEVENYNEKTKEGDPS